MNFVLTQDQSRQADWGAQIQKLNFTEKVKISAKRFSFFLGLAFISIFIPVLHFVLVPVFLLVAVLTLIKSSSYKSRLIFDQNHYCLSCSKPIKTTNVLRGDVRIQCEHCFSWHLNL